MRDIVKLGLVLAVVGAIAAASLACVNAATKPIIEEREEVDFQNSLKAVVPGAERLEKVEKGECVFYVAYKGNEQVGVAMPVESKGYSATPIVMLVGTDMKGKVLAVKVQSHAETPGLGGRITEPKFLRQFEGKSPDDPVTLGKDIDALSGSTVSSRAVSAGVKNALSTYKTSFLGVEAKPAVDVSKVPDGTYEGEGQGFGGKIKVSVRVSNGRITDVIVLEHQDNPSISDPAIEKIPQRIVEKQLCDIDVVSGATYTSNGITEAVTNALLENSAK